MVRVSPHFFYGVSNVPVGRKREIWNAWSFESIISARAVSFPIDHRS